MLQKIDELKEPPVVNKVYLVPVFKTILKGFIYNIPLINHLHSDKENGQYESHYHVDTRFIRKMNFWFYKRIYPHDFKDFNIEYVPIRCYNNTIDNITDVSLIANSKLKHKCIYKGKCPHRGYNLSQEIPINGIIICPLHGLKFNFKTKKLII